MTENDQKVSKISFSSLSKKIQTSYVSSGRTTRSLVWATKLGERREDHRTDSK